MMQNEWDIKSIVYVSRIPHLNTGPQSDNHFLTSRQVQRPSNRLILRLSNKASSFKDTSTKIMKYISH